MNINIVFIGCVESSKSLLIALLQCNVNIVGVITKCSSKFNSDFCDLSTICNNYGLDYIYCEDVNSTEIYEYIKSKKPDLIYCFGWSQLIKSEILDIPTKGCVGFHPAELPRNRGRHPIIWALALGLHKTASTFFFLSDGADNGDIISQEEVSISDEDDAQSLYEKIIKVSSKQVIDITNDFLENSIVRISQDEKQANYWRKRTKEDGKIDWRMNSKAIYNLVRALTKPYVGAHFVYNNKEIKVWSSKILEYKIGLNVEPGKVLKVFNDKSFVVKTGDGAILINSYEDEIIKEGEYLI